VSCHLGIISLYSAYIVELCSCTVTDYKNEVSEFYIFDSHAYLHISQIIRILFTCCVCYHWNGPHLLLQSPIMNNETNLLIYINLTYLLTYLLTPWSRVFLEKLTVSAASQEILRIFGTRKFITVLTSARHLSLS